MSQQLGDVINQARRARRWSLRQLAAQVHKEDGTQISPQYLNDIELNRRIPAPHVLRELAQVLELDTDHLLMLAGGGEAVVRGYFEAHPEQKEEVVRLFRNAKQRRFKDWGRLNRIIESESREGK
jgi:transcriptional regulator with XRE-family HTH domain